MRGSKTYEVDNMSEVEEMIKKFNKLPMNKIEGFDAERGIVKGPSSKRGGSYKPAVRGSGRSWK